MKTLNIFLSKLYIKYFLLLFISLEGFFAGIDFMYNYSSLADSANIKVIYLSYSVISAFSIIVPLCLVLALIVLSFRLIKSSELIAIYSIGYSKKDVIKPIFIVSFAISLFFISLNFTELAYAKERMDNILKNNSISNTKENIFLKNFNQYIYFNRLLPLEQKAIGVKIFTLENNNVTNIIYAKEAIFENNIWKIINATIYTNPKDIDFRQGNLEIQNVSEFYTLKGFKPTILNNVYDTTIQLSIVDAVSAITLLTNQDMNTSKIRSTLYSFLIYPLFASFLLIIVFYYIPSSIRLTNVLYLNSIIIFVVLVIWGGLFSLVKFTSIGTLNPEIGVILPVFIISLVSIYYYRRL